MLEPRLLLTNYVVTTLDDVPSDPSMISSDGQISLREAILAANLNMQVGDAPAGELGGASGVTDTITFDSSLMGQSVLLTQGELSITDDLDINGFGTPDNMTIDAQGNSRIFSITGAITVSMSHLTLTGGVASSGDGGGIYNLNALLTLADVNLIGNSASNGGGIFNAGTLSFSGGSILSNSASGSGGGIANHTSTGGGDIVPEAVASITNATIAMNVSLNGGGLSNAFGRTTIRQSTLNDNFADEAGGGIHNQGTLSLVNSTLSANSAKASGGGLRNLLGTASLAHATIVLNRANADGEEGGSGGGISTAADEFTTTTLSNTIVAGNERDNEGFNTASDLAGRDVDSSSGYNLIGDPGSAGGLMEGNNGNRVGDGMGNLLPIDEIVDPLLADNGGPTFTHLPVLSGRAIDGGDTAQAVDPGPDGILGTDDDEVLTTDQRGLDFPRVIDIPAVPNADGGVDIGAVELDFNFFEIAALSAVQAEGGPGTTLFTFTVTRTGNTAGPASVDYFISGSEVNGADFAGGLLPSGTVNFDNGQTEQTITIEVQGDFLVERDEDFFVELTNPGDNGFITTPTAMGTIQNDDTAQIVIDDVRQNENGVFQFTIRLSNPVSEEVSLEVDTLGLSAASGTDFLPIMNMIVTFPASGPLIQTVTVTIFDDIRVESNETFQVVLSNPLVGGISDPSRLSIDDGVGLGTIINNDAIRIAGAGTGQGLQAMPPQVIVQNAATGEILHNFLAYDGRFTGGVRVAAGDVNGDGAADVITAAGSGGGPHVKVFDGLSGQLIGSFFAYSPAFTGGVFVAAGDVNGDGRAEIFTGAGAGGGPHVRVFDGQTLQPIFDVFAYDPMFSGGVRVAAGDVDGDFRSDLITAAGPGGGPHVKVFDGDSLQTLGSFFAYSPAFQGGVFVAGGDVNDDGFADVITGAGAGGGPHVRLFDGRNLPGVLGEFFAFDLNMTAGITVGVTDLNGDAIAEILVGTGPGLPAQIRIFQSNGGLLSSDPVFNPHRRSGVFVGGSLAPEMTPTIVPSPEFDLVPEHVGGEAALIQEDSPDPENHWMGELTEPEILGKLLLEALDA